MTANQPAYDIKIPDDSPLESVRKRPQMYIGNVKLSGYQHIFSELLANAIDQCLMKYADTIDIETDGFRITVRDNGRSLAANEAVMNFICSSLTHPHSSASRDHHAPHIHVNRLGLGLWFINVISSEGYAEWSDDQASVQVRFGAGRICHKTIVAKTAEQPQGFTIQTRLDTRHFDFCIPERALLDHICKHAACLYPGIAISHNGQTYLSKHGLIDMLHMQVIEGLAYNAQETVHRFNGQAGDIIINAVIIGAQEQDSPAHCYSWVNGCLTAEHGSHVDGLLLATTACQKKPRIVLLSIYIDNPSYAGPCKDCFVNESARSQIYNFICQALKQDC